MRHIAFISQYYFPEAGSTSLCAISVVNRLNALLNVKISYICSTHGSNRIENIDNIEVHRINRVSYGDKLANETSPIKRRLLKLAKLIKDICHFSNYPDMDTPFSDRLYSELECISKENRIDVLVGTYLPYQAISAVLKFKNKHPNVSIVGYFLDTLRGNRPPYLPKKIHSRMCDRAEHKAFLQMDKIIIMQYAKEYYQSSVFDDVRPKMFFLNLPTLRIAETVKRHGGFKCGFLGTTYKRIRNPMFAINVFHLVHNELKEVSFHLYGLSDMRQELIDWQNKSQGTFYYHGSIPFEEVGAVYDDIDYIVSIGNSLKGVVPGKTFEIIGLRKPIIHFSDLENDSSLDSLMLYPSICIIDIKLGEENACRKLVDFFQKPYSLVDSSFISETFSSATPDSVCNEIINLLDKQNA